MSPRVWLHDLGKLPQYMWLALFVHQNNNCEPSVCILHKIDEGFISKFIQVNSLVVRCAVFKMD